MALDELPAKMTRMSFARLSCLVLAATMTLGGCSQSPTGPSGVVPNVPIQQDPPDDYDDYGTGEDDYGTYEELELIEEHPPPKKQRLRRKRPIAASRLPVPPHSRRKNR